MAEFDIVGFFDNLRHARLLREVAKVVDDVEVIGLIRRWLTAGVLTEAGLVARSAGTPQGGVISPLLANIYLHRLDVEVRAAGFRLIRYADDFVILADRRWKVEAADRLVRAVLAGIGLEVAEAKSGIAKTNAGFEFLGFAFSGRSLRPRPRALTGFKDRVRRLTPRKAPCSLAATIRGLNPLLRGWGGYFGRGKCHQPLRGPRPVDPDASAVPSTQAVQVHRRARPPTMAKPALRWSRSRPPGTSRPPRAQLRRPAVTEH